jgi:NAD(P)-dependent dehydrogenase (short-subunit alcohol dehydrogenase family)
LEDLFGLDGKVVWVIGGAGYLGQPVVHLLARTGAKVICADLDNRAFEFVQSAKFGSAVIPWSLDISKSERVKAFVKDQISEFGRPNGFVNMAFASTSKKLEELSEADFDQVNHTGLTSSFFLAREVGSEMAKNGGGSMVLFSSMYGMLAPDFHVYESPMNPNPIEYGVGKAGIIQMTKYLAMHYGRKNVRCNCISPGPFPNLSVQQKHVDFMGRLEGKTFLGRVGAAKEIAGSVCFLLSDLSSFTTGHNLVVDGGWTCW